MKLTELEKDTLYLIHQGASVERTEPVSGRERWKITHMGRIMFRTVEVDRLIQLGYLFTELPLPGSLAYINTSGRRFVERRL